MTDIKELAQQLNIMGADTSTEENSLWASQICQGFFHEPTVENFNKIESQDEDGSNQGLYLFKLAARDAWRINQNLTKSELLHLDLKRRLLLNSGTKLTIKDLDCLWCLYHATGDTKYSERVKGLFVENAKDPLSEIASQSYKKYIELQ